MVKVIELIDVMPIKDETLYKVHVASHNGYDHPLDAFVRSRDEWGAWNSWRDERDQFNRKYIFSLIQFYTEPDTWLFGGVYRVLGSDGRKRAHSYQVELTSQHEELIGRLKIHWKRKGRAKALRFENHLADFVVSEILKAPYTGESFCGYENICHDFQKLETIFVNARPDWKAALENVKGVYLLADKNNGKKYVGAAYGTDGIWARWSQYLSTGHGYHSDELTKLIKRKGIEYARKNFKISLLEYRPMKTDDEKIIERERYWIGALLSQGKFGYNRK